MLMAALQGAAIAPKRSTVRALTDRHRWKISQGICSDHPCKHPPEQPGWAIRPAGSAPPSLKSAPRALLYLKVAQACLRLTRRLGQGYFSRHSIGFLAAASDFLPH